MKYTLFNNTFATVGGEATICLEEFSGHLRTLIKIYAYQYKKEQPLIKFAVYEGCNRKEKYLRELHCIEVEHDAGTMTIVKAAEKLHKEGYAFFMYETWSCTDDHPRWRAFIPLAKPLKIKALGSLEALKASRRGFVNGLAGVLGDGVLSRESNYLSQCWYIGHQQAVRNPVIISNV